jgi:hypothetical protein
MLDKVYRPIRKKPDYPSDGRQASMSKLFEKQEANGNLFTFVK